MPLAYLGQIIFSAIANIYIPLAGLLWFQVQISLRALARRRSSTNSTEVASEGVTSEGVTSEGVASEGVTSEGVI